VVVNHTIAKNKEISLKAKGLFFTVMALPDNWDFSIEGICKILKEEKTAVYSAIKELKEHGYCKVEKMHDDDGKIKKWEYFFYEVPLSGFPQVDDPQVDDPQVGEPQVENQPQSNKEEINSLPQSSNHLSSSSALPLYRKIFRNTALTDKEESFLEKTQIANPELFNLILTRWDVKGWRPENVTRIVEAYIEELKLKEVKQVNGQQRQNDGNRGNYGNKPNRKSDAEIYREAQEQLRLEREREDSRL
jgi:hypothetical protein